MYMTQLFSANIYGIYSQNIIGNQPIAVHYVFQLKTLGIITAHKASFLECNTEIFLFVEDKINSVACAMIERSKNANFNYNIHIDQWFVLY
jgi:hypothetical protein